jgi:hypothetical protein
MPSKQKVTCLGVVRYYINKKRGKFWEEEEEGF